jgi:electron transfer flavoprotein beta subunit
VHIAVCIKQVPNPDALAAVLRVDEQAGCVLLPPGHPLVTSPFDEQAIEAALRIRDQLGAEVRITAITLGPEPARAALKQALALGADDAVHIMDASLANADAFVTAQVLASAVRKLEDIDLILAGRQAADWDAGIVGFGVAEVLDVACVSFACALQVNERKLQVERALQDGTETIEVRLPAVVTISNELGEVRKPNLRETMRAARKPVSVLNAADLGLNAGACTPRRTLKRLYLPRKSTHCECIEGASAAEQAAQLIKRLIDTRVIDGHE